MKLCQRVLLLVIGKRAGERRGRECSIGPYMDLWLKGDECIKCARK